MQPSATEPIGLLVATVRRAINAAVLARSEPLGVSSREFWTLVSILEGGGSSQTELATRMRRDEPSVSRVIRRLTLRGWVKTARGDVDRRRVEVALTPSGRALARRLFAHAEEIRAAVDGPLSPSEAAALRGGLQKIVGHLSRLCADCQTPHATNPRHAP